MYYVRSYKSIFITFLRYLPSRLLVVLNSFIIVPVLARLLTVQEVGIFQLLLGVLNLVCTCSTDWISKSVLRFYEKYQLSNRLDEFFSNTLAISVLVYALILILYFVFGDFFVDRFSVPKHLLFVTLVLVIPAGFRQFLYQMLRVFNKPYLYTLSIVVYQISMLTLFLIFTGFMPNVISVLFAMALAMIVIDIYLFKNIFGSISGKFKFNPDIMKESLIYALPQIITNTFVWSIFNVHRFVAQWNGIYDLTAVIGLGNMLISSVLTPIFSVFIFAMFPIFVRKFEYKANIQVFLTDSIRLYNVMFLPLACLFCFFAKDLSDIIFTAKYPNIHYVLALFALGSLFHEMMKLFNMKYHFKNKTYIEMFISILVGSVCLALTITLTPKFGVIGASFSMLFSMLFLIVCHSFVRFEDRNYVVYSKVIKTFLMSYFLFLLAYAIVFMLYIPINLPIFSLIKIAIYLFFAYMLTGYFAKNLLE